MRESVCDCGCNLASRKCAYGHVYKQSLVVGTRPSKATKKLHRSLRQCSAATARIIISPSVSKALRLVVWCCSNYVFNLHLASAKPALSFRAQQPS